MDINFFAILEDFQTMKLYDISPINETLPTNVYSMTLDILSSQIPNGRIDAKLDVIAYLMNQREQKEIYTVTGNILGMGESSNIPDGVYHIHYDINNGILKQHTFLVYQNVAAEVKKLTDAVNYGVTINNYDYEFVGDFSDSDLERVRLCVSLLDELEIQSSTPNEVLVNDTLDKLERLLEIVKIDINI